jgi:uncharacterized protein YbjT (DUF2867 family)
MKVALIIGASGLTGKKLTRIMLADKRYSEVKILVRKPLDFIYEKLEQITMDFDHPDASKIAADEVYCSMGTTINKAGSKAAFRKVDYEYVYNLAKIAHANGATKFALVSAMGANKNSGIFYNKVKGEIEEAIAGIGFESYFIFRPSLLLGHRSEFRPGEAFAQFFMTTFSFLLPKKYRPISSKKLAEAMMEIMNNPAYKGKQVFESDVLNSIVTANG